VDYTLLTSPARTQVLRACRERMLQHCYEKRCKRFADEGADHSDQA
jgi:hypothetical protein